MKKNLVKNFLTLFLTMLLCAGLIPATVLAEGSDTVTIKVVWDDYDNRDNLRPESVYVVLFSPT